MKISVKVLSKTRIVWSFGDTTKNHGFTVREFFSEAKVTMGPTHSNHNRELEEENQIRHRHCWCQKPRKCQILEIGFLVFFFGSC
ncbi:hypothetical protein ACB092_09G206700 [Castanea dentata]